jgi:hypothetical protein
MRRLLFFVILLLTITLASGQDTLWYVVGVDTTREDNVTYIKTKTIQVVEVDETKPDDNEVYYIIDDKKYKPIKENKRESRSRE